VGEPEELLVLRDGEGRYYVLPRTVLEQALVPEEHQRDVEALVREADVRGFLWDGSVPNVMEILFVTMRESIRESNEDKKYYLGRLAGQPWQPRRYPP
jgi:hypothetical protein